MRATSPAFRASLRAVAALSALSLLACCFGPIGNVAGTDAGPPVVAPPPPLPPAEVRMTLVAIDVVMPATKPDGAAWDVGGGAPDPMVVVRQRGVTLATTARQQDTYSAYWELAAPFDRTLPLEIEVVDRDVAADDGVGVHGFSFAEGVTSGDAELSARGGSIHVEAR